LLRAWSREAPAKEFVRLGERLARMAEQRREGTLIYLADRVRQRSL
jgi:hypothetical protein